MSILKELDEEYCYGYDIIDYLSERKELKKAIERLKKLEMIIYEKGLMTESGRAAGSGWCLSSKGAEYVNEFE